MRTTTRAPIIQAAWSVRPSVRPFVRPTVRPSVRPSVHHSLFDEKWKLEKLYEFKGIEPKLRSYRPVGEKSYLAHLFVFFWPAMAGHGRPWPAMAGHGRPKKAKRCARCDFSPTGLYDRSFDSIPLNSYSFSSFHF